MNFDAVAFGRDLGIEMWEVIKPLERRIAELEARPEVKFMGVWLDQNTYGSGNLAVHNGSLWCAQARTKSRPGTDSSWTLVCKQGTFSK
jgi:hypothetical protein